MNTYFICYSVVADHHVVCRFLLPAIVVAVDAAKMRSQSVPLIVCECGCKSLCVMIYLCVTPGLTQIQTMKFRKLCVCNANFHKSLIIRMLFRRRGPGGWQRAECARQENRTKMRKAHIRCNTLTLGKRDSGFERCLMLILNISYVAGNIDLGNSNEIEVRNRKAILGKMSKLRYDHKHWEIWIKLELNIFAKCKCE